MDPKAIKALLVRASISQAGIARKTGVSKVTVHRIISGEYTNTKVMEEVARSLGLEVRDLWPDAKNAPETS